MTVEDAKRNIGCIVYDVRSGQRYFLKKVISDICFINKMIGSLDENKEYWEWKSDINYCTDCYNLSENPPNDINI